MFSNQINLLEMKGKKRMNGAIRSNFCPNAMRLFHVLGSNDEPNISWGEGMQ
jgi:hypothetical protein